jgi:hypothetical protein
MNWLSLTTQAPQTKWNSPKTVLRKMKRTLCSVLLAATLLIAPGAGFAQTPFDDIQSSQALADIETVYQKGIMLGTVDNKFNPDDIVDRAQLAVCLVRTFDLDINDLQFVKEPVPSDLYDDVEDNTWLVRLQ